MRSFKLRFFAAFFFCSASLAMFTYAAMGNWSIATSPNSSFQDNLLNAVTCVSASDCWSAGSYLQGTNHKTLIQRWDGNSWTTVNSPNAVSFGWNVLYGVACASPSDCWAVGYQQSTSPTAAQTLIERWDGVAWSIVPSPNSSANQQNYLQSVACTSANNCWAVGYSFLGTIFVGPGLLGTPIYQTLIVHWDGTTWTIVPSANTSATQSNILSSVTCNSTSDCWAVGHYDASTSGAYPTLAQTLVQHWNGSAWSIVPSPNTLPVEENLFTSVTCTSGSNCWAVGYRFVNTFTGLIYQTLTARWNGSSWSIVPSPNSSPTQQNFLFGVTCDSPSDCWAVGFYLNQVYQTLIEHWDGATWSIVPSPNTNAAQTNILRSVECPVSWDCWAVGSAAPNGGAMQTMPQHYVAAAPPPVELTSVVSRKNHGSAGPFDINLPLVGIPGVECRSGGANDDYSLIFSFANPLARVGGAAVTSGNGTVSSHAIGSDAREYVVNLTGVTNAQTITVTLTNVTDSSGNGSAAIGISMGVLLGDVTANRLVSNTDVSAVKAQISAAVGSSNFRSDVNANGIVSNTDVSVTKAQVSTTLP